MHFHFGRNYPIWWSHCPCCKSSINSFACSQHESYVNFCKSCSPVVEKVATSNHIRLFTSLGWCQLMQPQLGSIAIVSLLQQFVAGLILWFCFEVDKAQLGSIENFDSKFFNLQGHTLLAMDLCILFHMKVEEYICSILFGCAIIGAAGVKAWNWRYFLWGLHTKHASSNTAQVCTCLWR